MNDTIFALATGSLGSAVAVVRISGPRVGELVVLLTGQAAPPRQALLREIRDPFTSELIDIGLVIFFQAPRSFTGEDCLELQLHGSRAVIKRLFEVLGSQPSTRMAEPGEFIRRAFDQGKFPLTSVEGIADLIEARTDAQRRQALSQAGGALAGRAAAWRTSLMDALSLLEAEIDFADEGEAPSNVLPEVRSVLQVLRSEFDEAIIDAERGEIIRSGAKVVIAGPANAGKSSLLNALAKREVAIVTDVAGTTRDVLEVDLDLCGFEVRFCDTAGLRETADVVEAIGIGRAREAIDSATLVLWLTEAASISADLDPMIDRDRCLVVGTKGDLVVSIPDWADLVISTRSGAGLPDLVTRISHVVSARLAGEPPLVTNERQLGHIRTACYLLDKAISSDGLELMADDLRVCASELRGLVGAISADDVLGSIFSRFCMGK